MRDVAMASGRNPKPFLSFCVPFLCPSLHIVVASGDGACRKEPA